MSSLKIKNKSPLRYPGGKTRAIALLYKAVQESYPRRRILVSPFFGGGSFELYCQSNGYQVYANDLFTPLYTFWKILQESKDKLVDMIRSMMPVSKQNFNHFRSQIQKTTNEMEIAAMYFIINRCSFNGSTFCGGFSKESSMKRLTESSLERVLQVNVNQTTFSNLKFQDFLNQYPETEETIVFADPPYYISSYIYGRDGDLHESFDHRLFSEIIQQRSDWVLCYNDCSFIRNLYQKCRIQTVSWKYGMNKSKLSSEILIFPPLTS